MQPMVQLNNVRYQYPNGYAALDGIDLTVYTGQCCGILGPNGAGKTTLLYHLNGLLLPQSGSVVVDGLSVGANKKQLFDVRRRVGFLFQDPNDQLFCPTVFEDVAFGYLQAGYSQEHLSREIDAVLSKVGLEGYQQRFCHELSLGEKKRVALAGVLITRPTILVMDEPAANLDPSGKRWLLEWLTAWEGTSLIVSHDFEVLKALCCRLVIISDGLIRADGATQKIMQDRVLLEKYRVCPFAYDW